MQLCMSSIVKRTRHVKLQEKNKSNRKGVRESFVYIIAISLSFYKALWHTMDSTPAVEKMAIMVRAA